MERAETSGKALGTVYTAISGALLAVSFIFAQYLLEYMTPEMMELAWFAAAAVLAIIVAAIARKANPFYYLRANLKEGIFLGLTNGTAALLWAFSIKLTNASMTAFFLRFTTIFIIIIGIFFLKERLQAWEIIGAAIAIFGAFTLSFKEPSAIHFGIAVIILTALVSAISEILAKIYVKKIEPYTLSAIRTSFSLLAMIAIIVPLGRLTPVPLWTIPVLAVASLVTAVFGFIFYYKAFELIEISQAAIIRTLDPFFVVIYAFIIFGTFPSGNEMIGGALIVAGVIVSQIGPYVGKNFKAGITSRHK